MEELANLYNKLFYKFLYPSNSNQDILLKDLARLDNDNIEKKVMNNIMRNINKNIHIKHDNNINNNITHNNINNIKIKNHKFESDNNLNNFSIKDILYRIKEEKDQKKVESILDKIMYKNIPSTIYDIDTYLDNIKHENKLNILILGGGPNGLFLANYIWSLYKNYYNSVNILVIDNRIKKKGFRTPFLRNRLFAIGEQSYLSYIIPKISCFNKSTLIEIKYLEMLLYLKLYENKIPIYFTNKYNNYKRVLKLIKDYNFKVCFDSTGGRIKTPFKVSKFNFPKNISFKSNNYSLIKNNNLLEIEWNDNIKNKYYLFISYLDTDFKNIKYNKNFYILNNKKDYHLLTNICISKQNINILIDKITDNNLKLFLYKISDYFFINKDIVYLHFNSIEIKLYHQLKIAFLINKKKALWIGSGDTLFHSHFLLGSGLYRTIPLNVKIVNLLELLLNK